MKIIGQAGGQRWIVEASEQELARVAGVAYAISLREKGGTIRINAEIEVSKLFDRLEGIRSCERQLISAQNTLRAVADLIGPVRAYIDQAQYLDTDQPAGDKAEG